MEPKAGGTGHGGHSQHSTGRILHLSDLHLGPVQQSQWLDHDRFGISADDRRAERDLLRETLESLAEEGALSGLEAVVISGDLTNFAEQDGFDFFGRLIDVLELHVKPEQILVVPGNHDVPKDHGPGDQHRYDRFLAATRARKLATPLLDGIDFDSGGVLTAAADENPHLVFGSDFVIVPVNSSHFCWGTKPLPSKVMDGLFDVSIDQVEKATRDLRTFDMPRVSNAQIDAIRRHLAGQQTRISDEMLRIGVLHHHLLPINPREEVKGFESLTNLAAVRELFASFRASVILHGHKHEAALYWDYVATQEGLDAEPRRVLVTAAPAKFREGMPVGRLLQVAGMPRAPEVILEEVLAADRRGDQTGRGPLRRARLWPRLAPYGDQGTELISAATISEVYARIQSRFAGVGDDVPLRYLICEIADARDSGTPPVDYPGGESRGEWMSDLVEWWQLPEPQLGHGVSFNHGERIYHRWGDQVQRAADVLSSPNDPDTTRASILLLDPQTEASAVQREFPSFVSVLLQLVKVSGGWRLDCSGLFRKQEMRYWWPINVAELADVQREVAHRIRLDDGAPRPGLLRTITAYAVVEEKLPVVSVPSVDRAVDQHLPDLWHMAYGLMQPDSVSSKSALRRTWDRYLEELRPDVSKEEVPAMSHRGLQAIQSFVSVAAPQGPDAEEAAAALDGLVHFYGLFKNPSAAAPREVAEQAAEKLDRLDLVLDRLLGTLQ